MVCSTYSIPGADIGERTVICRRNHCCRSWSAQAWKLLGNVHMCPSQCPICAQHVYKLGHSLHTETTAWLPLVHWSCIHACTQAWAHVYISKQFPSLGTPTFTAVNLPEGLVFSRDCPSPLKWHAHSLLLLENSL